MLWLIGIDHNEQADLLKLLAFAVHRMRGIFSVTIILLVAFTIAVEAVKKKGELLLQIQTPINHADHFRFLALMPVIWIPCNI